MRPSCKTACRADSALKTWKKVNQINNLAVFGAAVRTDVKVAIAALVLILIVLAIAGSFGWVNWSSLD
jgi:acyl CoA:acetate/3-ketoacid CoA transferase alpha subunit